MEAEQNKIKLATREGGMGGCGSIEKSGRKSAVENEKGGGNRADFKRTAKHVPRRI